MPRDEQFGSLVIHDHPSMNEAKYNKQDGLVSMYDGKRIPTKRKKGNGGIMGDGDPPNSNLVALHHGELDLAELDDEEIAHGIPKCDDGKFSAKAAYQAAKLPKPVQRKLQQELYRRAENMLRGNLLNAIASIADIAMRPDVEDKDRLKAAQYLLERNMGKVPDVVQHTQDKPWEVVFDSVGRQQPDQPDQPNQLGQPGQPELNNTVDAEVIDDTNDSEEPTP